MTPPFVIQPVDGDSFGMQETHHVATFVSPLLPTITYKYNVCFETKEKVEA